MRKTIDFLKDFRALKISLSLKFIIGTATALVMAMGISLYFISVEHEKLVYKQMDVQARVLFTQIVLTRKWIADHGGVFVGSPINDPSPYMKDAEITDTRGRKYLKKSPAMVTKSLSKYAEKEGIYWFNITSLKLINPENAPDDFERAALIDFEEGMLKEASAVEEAGSSSVYRYIAPLYIKESCLECHAHQNYEVGDVRGAISIALPMDNAISMISLQRRGMITASFVTVAVLMFVLYIMMKELVLRPVNDLNTSMKAFSSGRMPQTYVIRTGDELEELSRSFVDMSRSLSEYHAGLEEKVKNATKSLKMMNARLVELNEKKSDFIAQVSHELRTPLTSIKGSMDYISSKLSMSSVSDTDIKEVNEFFDVIRNNADRLIRMVNDTLDLERIESGVVEMHLSDLNISSLIKEVITGFYAMVDQKGVFFRVVADSGTKVFADEDMIRQVLINLISNALNVSPEDAEIEISVSETADKVTIFIRDRGHGVSESERDRIFEKYYTKIGSRGTGLGLPICKGLVEAHKGEIGVYGNEYGAGSTFYFSLSKKSEDV